MLSQLSASRLAKSAILFSALTVEMNASAEETEKDQNSVHAVLGAGVLGRPEFPGSDSTKIEALPLINLRYKRFFLGGLPGFENGLGFMLHEGEHWTFAAVGLIDVEEPRKESDDVRLFGLGDIEPTTHAGLFASYRVNWFSLNAVVLTDVDDNGQGTVVNLGARVAYQPTQRLHLSIGPAITWGNEEHMQTFFGIDEQQSLRSGYTPFEADAGASRVRFTVGGRYHLSPNWGIGASIMASRFLDDVSDSPVIQDRNQLAYGLFVTYRF